MIFDFRIIDYYKEMNFTVRENIGNKVEKVGLVEKNDNAEVKTKVTAVLPAYNAEKTLYKTFIDIPLDIVTEVIMVDDASTDDTVEKAKQINDLIVVIHEKNRGYGGNQKTCYSEALKRGAGVVVMIHPDWQYDPKCVPNMIKPIVSGEADFVIGSRFLNADPRQGGMVWWRYLGNRLLTTLHNKVMDVNLSEGHSGYRAYSRKFLEKIDFNEFSDDFVFDSQMLAVATRAKYRITEVPIPTRYEDDSSSISFLKSVRYGLLTLMTLVKRG